MIEKALIVLMAIGALLLWGWLTRKLGRGHLGAERSIDHHISEQETRRHPF